jgi:hypothetical protein
MAVFVFRFVFFRARFFPLSFSRSRSSRAAAAAPHEKEKKGTPSF